MDKKLIKLIAIGLAAVLLIAAIIVVAGRAMKSSGDQPAPGQTSGSSVAATASDGSTLDETEDASSPETVSGGEDTPSVTDASSNSDASDEAVVVFESDGTSSTSVVSEELPPPPTEENETPIMTVSTEDAASPSSGSGDGASDPSAAFETLPSDLPVETNDEGGYELPIILDG